MPDWKLYIGSADPHDVDLPDAPPWRRFDGSPTAEPEPIAIDPVDGSEFRPDGETIEAVNAALHLRRPLLLTGRPGSGKSSLIAAVARELRLGPVLRWHVTSRSSLQEALYRYDAIGRLHANSLEAGTPPLSDFLRLGPLGTALLPTTRPRALLIDEIDKGDIDLPNDLLDVLERGEFEIPELTRIAKITELIREDASDRKSTITRGRVRCLEFPFVVLTSNGERDFPPAFLRRCIRHQMPDPGPAQLAEIIAAHLGPKRALAAAALVKEFAKRAAATKALSTDQLLNAAHLVTSQLPPEGAERERVVELLLRQLTSDQA